MNKINILNDTYMYIIETEPYEPTKDSYERAWYIINNYDKEKYNIIVSESIIKNNVKNGMIYE
jgi:hypothetical protein